MRRSVASLFPARGPASTARSVAEALRTETVGGTIMLVAAVIALVWANSPWRSSYLAVTVTPFGAPSLDLDLSLHKWASDGLLALFFVVAGLEVKREMVVGELRHPSRAALPIIAAVAGMAVPALFYLVVSLGSPDAVSGWAVPMATDVAFALAVLAVTGSRLPDALRVFLLTLTVVDDLGAIAVIAVFYTDELHVKPLLGAVAVLAGYGLLQWRRFRWWPVYLVLAIVAWVLVHDSGVHGTVAGVVIGLLTRVRTDPGEDQSPADRLEHHLRPISAGFAVPVFAFAAAGISLHLGTFQQLVTDRVALGVAVGLLAGKFAGVFGGAWLAVRLGLARLSDDLHWGHLAAVGLLAGIGFTVSLLIGELAYGNTQRTELVKAAVLVTSAVASVLAAVLLRLLTRRLGARRSDTGTSIRKTRSREREDT